MTVATLAAFSVCRTKKVEANKHAEAERDNAEAKNKTEAVKKAETEAKKKAETEKEA